LVLQHFVPFDLKYSEVTRDSLSRTFRKSPLIFVGETSAPAPS